MSRIHVKIALADEPVAEVIALGPDKSLKAWALPLPDGRWRISHGLGTYPTLAAALDFLNDTPWLATVLPLAAPSGLLEGAK